ncbi:helix-turn-helix domain-containing protein [Billgrantia endophytica]|uniref:DNA binding HTH domain-containing protein n=1 Tax=Billgrantia endophytica TaxID=2033802 RepID=A0A2N7U2E8_9GAMM|nr:helix-turn-helix domain-containing protein [Halomonas endophytica]PMR74599.1 hypothetical protein C1H69_12080 [Halomonas endophytica]
MNAAPLGTPVATSSLWCAAIKALGHGARRDDIITLKPGWLDLPHGQILAVLETSAEQEESPVDEPLRVQVAAIQRRAIRRALAACGGNWASAARRLAVDPSNLHKLASRLGVK